MSVEKIARYPRWIQEIIMESETAKLSVSRHAAWRLLCDGTVTAAQHRILFLGFWSLIEKFPHFMALNLVKTSFGKQAGINATRAWLAKNIRIEQRHAEWFMYWAEGAGISREELFDEPAPVEATAITDWCWRVCESGGLTEALAATNYAIEGVTGEWAREVAGSDKYRSLFEESHRDKAMRWLDAHAAYDDRHPWEALDLINAILGSNPSATQSRAIKNAVVRSYDLYRLALDVCIA